jgi:hypothetical protein
VLSTIVFTLITNVSADGSLREIFPSLPALPKNFCPFFLEIKIIYSPGRGLLLKSVTITFTSANCFAEVLLLPVCANAAIGITEKNSLSKNGV